jgi:hypothetical protein
MNFWANDTLPIIKFKIDMWTQKVCHIRVFIFIILKFKFLTNNIKWSV